MSTKHERIAMWSAVTVFATLAVYLLLRMYTPPAQKSFQAALSALVGPFPEVQPTASLDPNAIISLAVKLPAYGVVSERARMAARRFVEGKETECYSPSTNDIQAVANEQQYFLSAMLAARRQELAVSRSNKYALATIALARAVFLNSQYLVSPFTETYRRAQMQSLIKSVFKGSQGLTVVTSNYTILTIVHQCARALLNADHPEAMKLSPMMRALLAPHADRLNVFALSIPKGEGLTIPDTLLSADMLASCLAVQAVYDAALAEANPSQYKCQIPVPPVKTTSTGLK